MSNGNGNGTLKWAAQLLVPALMAAIGAYGAVASRVAVLEERIAGLRAELVLSNEQNNREHQRLEAADTALASIVRDKR